MTIEYFIQYSHQSVINRFEFPKDIFTSISISIELRNAEGFIFSLVHNMFNFPIFFAFEDIVFEQGLNSLIEKEIPLHKFSKEGYIIKIDTMEQLKIVCDLSEEVASAGLSVYIFHGGGLSVTNLIPTTHWSKPTVFNDLDFQKVETFIEITEVGPTIYSKSSLFNTPVKVINFIPAHYKLDLENSDI